MVIDLGFVLGLIKHTISDINQNKQGTIWKVGMMIDYRNYAFNFFLRVHAL